MDIRTSGHQDIGKDIAQIISLVAETEGKDSRLAGIKREIYLFGDSVNVW